MKTILIAIAFAIGATAAHATAKPSDIVLEYCARAAGFYGADQVDSNELANAFITCSEHVLAECKSEVVTG